MDQTEGHCCVEEEELEWTVGHQATFPTQLVFGWALKAGFGQLEREVGPSSWRRGGGREGGLRVKHSEFRILPFFPVCLITLEEWFDSEVQILFL